MKKKFSLDGLQEQLDILAAYDYHIIQFSKFHYRIEGRLDFWPTRRSAYDILSRCHGYWEDGDLVRMVFEEFPYVHPKMAQ
jgi:hypothetical protein